MKKKLSSSFQTTKIWTILYPYITLTHYEKPFHYINANDNRCNRMLHHRLNHRKYSLNIVDSTLPIFMGSMEFTPGSQSITVNNHTQYGILSHRDSKRFESNRRHRGHQWDQLWRNSRVDSPSFSNHAVRWLHVQSKSLAQCYLRMAQWYAFIPIYLAPFVCNALSANILSHSSLPTSRIICKQNPSKMDICQKTIAYAITEDINFIPF